jgi:hypothetical protein
MVEDVFHHWRGGRYGRDLKIVFAQKSFLLVRASYGRLDLRYNFSAGARHDSCNSRAFGPEYLFSVFR